jgi:hypothetical protein
MKKVPKIPFIVILVLLTVIGIVFSAGVHAKIVGKKVICDYCKEEIKTQYVEVDGKHFHPIHFMCENCGNPILDLKYYKKDGKYYCEKCYKELFAPRCAYCGGILDSDYIIVDGKNYHDSCYNNHVALRCDLCGKIIKGQYQVDYWGNKYCAEHENKIPKCDYCGRYISDELTQGGHEYGDGRNICGLCEESAVTDINKARSFLNEVKAQLLHKGIVIDYGKIGLHLVSRDELQKKQGTQNGNEMGFVEYEYTTRENLTVIKSFDIYLLYGMPETYYFAIAAHELMHVWQYLHGMIGNDPAFCEGSCNYAAYLVLKDYPDKFAEYLIYNLENDKDEIYGDGFRRVKKLVDDYGIDYWLNQLKENRNFPVGY